MTEEQTGEQLEMSNLTSPLNQISNRFTIILDVDQTLVHAIDKSKKKSIGKILNSGKCYIETQNYYVILRPGIFEFIDYCFTMTHYVVLWSSGTLKYIEEVCDFLLTQYSFYRVITRSTYDMIEKNLDFIYTDKQMAESTIIFVDDKPDRIKTPKDNVLIMEIAPFYFDNDGDVDEGLIQMQQTISLIAS